MQSLSTNLFHRYQSPNDQVEEIEPLISTGHQQQKTSKQLRKVFIVSVYTGFTLVGMLGLKNLVTTDYDSSDHVLNTTRNIAHIIFSLTGTYFFKQLVNDKCPCDAVV